MRTIQDQLKAKGLTDKSVEVRKEKPKEELTARDLAELMGTNRDTYRRARGGAMRQR